ncbi:MAG: HD domain-containing protein [Pirellulaceae bacterium]
MGEPRSQDHSDGSVELSIDQIRVGSVCDMDVFDEAGRVLIGKGVALSEHFLDELKIRGIKSLRVSRGDVQKLTGDASSIGEAADICSRRADRSSEPLSDERSVRFATEIGTAITALSNLGADISAGATGSFDQLHALQAKFLEMLIEDTDQSISEAGRTDIDDALAKRSAQFSMLSMATAVEMRMSEEDVLLAGSCGLLHDIGLYSLPAHFRDPAHQLTFAETNQYRKHSEISAGILAQHPIFGDELGVVVMQVHEFPDGSGYPRGIQKHRFHRLTSLLSFVDFFITLINPTPTRPPMVPYDAITCMLFKCRTGLIDATLWRAFINQCSLYGIDSKVVLDNGQGATVIRRDAEHYDRPVILKEGDDQEITRLKDSDRQIKTVYRGDVHLKVDRATIEALPMAELLRIS